MSTTFILENIVNFLKGFDSNVLNSCSVTGEMKMSNLTLDNSTFVLMWPTGDYQTKIRFYDQIDDNIFNVTCFNNR